MDASTVLEGTTPTDAGSGAPSGSGASSESDSFAVALSGPIAGSIAANPAVAAIPTAHRARRAGWGLRRRRARRPLLADVDVASGDASGVRAACGDVAPGLVETVASIALTAAPLAGIGGGGGGGADIATAAPTGGGNTAAGCAGAGVDGSSAAGGFCPRLARSRAIRSSGVSSLIGYLSSRP